MHQSQLPQGMNISNQNNAQASGSGVTGTVNLNINGSVST